MTISSARSRQTHRITNMSNGKTALALGAKGTPNGDGNGKKGKKGKKGPRKDGGKKGDGKTGEKNGGQHKL